MIMRYVCAVRGLTYNCYEYVCMMYTCTYVNDTTKGGPYIVGECVRTYPNESVKLCVCSNYKRDAYDCVLTTGGIDIGNVDSTEHVAVRMSMATEQKHAFGWTPYKRQHNWCALKCIDLASVQRYSHLSESDDKSTAVY